jgi:hypothetical protein
LSLNPVALAGPAVAGVSSGLVDSLIAAARANSGVAAPQQGGGSNGWSNVAIGGTGGTGGW